MHKSGTPSASYLKPIKIFHKTYVVIQIKLWMDHSKSHAYIMVTSTEEDANPPADAPARHSQIHLQTQVNLAVQQVILTCTSLGNERNCRRIELFLIFSVAQSK